MSFKNLKFQIEFEKYSINQWFSFEFSINRKDNLVFILSITFWKYYFSFFILNENLWNFIKKEEIKLEEKILKEEVIKYLNTHFYKNEKGHWCLKVDEKKFTELYNNGASYKEIAENCNMAPGSVNAYIKKFNLKK